MRTYLIILVAECNGCYASNTIARRLPSGGWRLGPRCDCGKRTGPMQWSVLGRVKVKTGGQLQALAKYREFKEKKCAVCIHRATIPGDAHTRCEHPFVRGSKVAKNPLGSALSILASVGRVEPVMDLPVARKLSISADPIGIKNGWFNWPWNFDPAWLRTCVGFEGVAE